MLLIEIKNWKLALRLRSVTKIKNLTWLLNVGQVIYRQFEFRFDI